MDFAYHWLEIRVEQHISIGVNSKVVAIWSKLQEKETKREMFVKGRIEGPRCQISTSRNRLAFMYVYLCSVCSYSKSRCQSLNIFQGNINSHNPQDELVLRFLREKKRKSGVERVTVSPVVLSG